MAQPSILQPLSGPLAGKRFEFHGADVVVGSAPDCEVCLAVPGVEAHHARIVIDVTGATIYRLDGIVGVNDDVVLGDGLLRSGDFVWIGEPGAETSLMLQFTLGDVVVEASVPASPAVVATAAASEEFVEELAAEDLPVPAATEEVMVEESPSQGFGLAAPAVDMMELPAEPVQEGPLMEEPAFEEAHLEEAHFEEAHLEEPQAELASADLEPIQASIDESIQQPMQEPIQEMEQSFEEPAELVAAPSPSSSSPFVPPAPWQTAPAASEPEEPKDYASAWESAPAQAAPAPPPPEEAPKPAPPPPAAPKPVARPSMPTPAAGTKRPPATSGVRKAPEPTSRATTPPPAPPARTTSSAPMIVGGLVALVVLAGVGYMFLGGTPEPAAPTPTPRPAAATPAPVAATPVPEPTQVAVAEPTPQPTIAPTEAPATPTPRTTPSPAGRATPTPKATPSVKATPSPAATRPGAGPATPTPVAAPVAPVSQAPRMLEEARAASAARDYAKAVQVLDQLLKLEPGNAEAASRKAEAEAKMAAASRKFAVGGTSVIGGKAAKGPSGFDLGGGAVVKTDFSAQIRCTTTPAVVEVGTFYTVRCTILNIGAKAFKIESVAANEVTDGAKAAGSGTAPRQELAPQSDAVILEKSGAWSAKSQWSLEIVAKTTKDESFRAVVNWR